MYKIPLSPLFPKGELFLPQFDKQNLGLIGSLHPKSNKALCDILRKSSTWIPDLVDDTLLALRKKFKDSELCQNALFFYFGASNRAEAEKID